VVNEVDHTHKHNQARRLAQALLAPVGEAACTACLDTLEEYITDQLAGADYVSRWPAAAQHLDSCVACAESYALLYEVRLASRAAPQPARVPAADLSFLQAGAAGPLLPDDLRAARRAWRLRAALGAAVERTGARLRLTLSRSLLNLLPPPSAGPALAFRSGEGAPLLELALDEPGAEVEQMQLSAYAESEGSEQCVVRIQLALRDHAWPDLAGVRVTLVAGDERRQAATDAWGEAVFAAVPVAALLGLQVEVDAGG
jgi:hypothetical protein